MATTSPSKAQSISGCITKLICPGAGGGPPPKVTCPLTGTSGSPEPPQPAMPVHAASSSPLQVCRVKNRMLLSCARYIYWVNVSPPAVVPRAL